MKALEQFLGLFFGAIVVMLILTNPKGVEAVGKAISGLTAETVKAFRV